MPFPNRVITVGAALCWLGCACPALGADLLYRIKTVAGSGSVGDGGPAFQARLSDAQSVAVDGTGTIYFSDAELHRVRKISPSGVISAVAGNGQPGFSGDGGRAADAQLNAPYGIALDDARNLYIADLGNNRVRKVTPDGSITTVAGNGQRGSAGDGGPAASAQLLAPRNIAVDPAGNLYISEFEGHRIRKVTSGGQISTLAGNGIAGFAGDDGPATAAQLAFPAGIAASRTGDLYICDTGNQRIRKVSSGLITTVINQAIATGLALNAAGEIYIAQSFAGTVAKLNGKTAAIIAGGGPGAGYFGDNGPPAFARLVSPNDVALDATGNIYLADRTGIRKISTSGIISTIAGDGDVPYRGDGGSATAAWLSFPTAVAMDALGTLYVADQNDHRIRKVTPAGTISTIAGTGVPGFQGDGKEARSAQLAYPGGASADSAGNIYIADTGNHRIRKIDPSGTITTVAGNGSASPGPEGTAAMSTALPKPASVSVDAQGNYYVAIPNRVIRIVPGGLAATVAGNGSSGYAGDGGAAQSAELSATVSAALDSNGELYIADSGNHRIRKVSGGIITTVAGTGVPGFSGDEGPAASAQLNSPCAVALDSGHNLYIGESGNQRIRKVTPDGKIHTIAGNGTQGFGGDGGPALSAQMSLSPAYTCGIVVDGLGNVFFADTLNNRVRELSPAAVVQIEPAPSVRVVNAASLLSGPVAPGELVAIFGSSMGPATGAGPRLSSASMLDSTLSGTQVFFDGKPAALLYAQESQINCQAPYEIAGQTSTRLEVFYQGLKAGAVTLPVANAAPGIFTISGGAGQAAVVNEDGRLNSTDNPAPRGSIVTFYATGEGQTKPEGVSGKLAAEPYPSPALPITVTMAGLQTDVLFAGSAPGFAGLLQINTRVPGGFLSAGSIPVAFTVGTATSQAGVTLAVR